MIESIVLTNTTNLQSVLLDKEISELVLDEADLGTVKGTHHSYSYLNQVGVYIDSTTLGDRTVSISGWVIGDTYEELLLNKKVLNHLVNPMHSIDVIYKDRYKLTFKPDYSVQYSVSYEENNEVLCKFLIQGTCPDPTFTTKERQTALVSSIVPKFHFPLVIPKDKGIIMGLRKQSLVATLNNEGDINTGLLITISCTGEVTNPTIQNLSTQEFIKINKELTTGEQIIISTSSGEKYIKGILKGVESNYFKYMDFDSSWIQLKVGENTLKYTAEEGANNLEVLISFLPRYLEVQ